MIRLLRVFQPSATGGFVLLRAASAASGATFLVRGVDTTVALGKDQWPYVRGLIHGAADHHNFDQFAKSFEFQSLESLPIADIPLHDGSLSTSIAEYVGPLLNYRQCNEKAVQPVIHSTLTCAAMSAGQHMGVLLFVESKPSVFEQPGRRVADEAVYEAVKGLDRLRILVEVKAQKHFRFKTLCTDDLEAVFLPDDTGSGIGTSQSTVAYRGAPRIGNFA